MSSHASLYIGFGRRHSLHLGSVPGTGTRVVRMVLPGMTFSHGEPIFHFIPKQLYQYGRNICGQQQGVSDSKTTVLAEGRGTGTLGREAYA
jgi:hypothetical protein